MKIHWTEGPPISKAPSKDSGQKKPDVEFKKIMEQLLDNKETKQMPPDANTLPGLAAVSSVSMDPPPGKVPDTKALLGEIQDLLDNVEFYAQKLADSSISAKELAPLVTHLEQRTSELLKYTSTGKVSQGLGQIISDLALTISAEVAKFKRGDYV